MCAAYGTWRWISSTAVFDIRTITYRLSLAQNQATIKQYQHITCISYEFACSDLIILKALSFRTLYFNKTKFGSISSQSFLNKRYLSIYWQLISLHDVIDSESSKYGSQEYQNLIGYWTFIASSKPYDLGQRKAYYHA